MGLGNVNTSGYIRYYPRIFQNDDYEFTETAKEAKSPWGLQGFQRNFEPAHPSRDLKVTKSTALIELPNQRKIVVAEDRFHRFFKGQWHPSHLQYRVQGFLERRDSDQINGDYFDVSPVEPKDRKAIEGFLKTSSGWPKISVYFIEYDCLIPYSK